MKRESWNTLEGKPSVVNDAKGLKGMAFTIDFCPE